jgi:hypothetical protein
MRVTHSLIVRAAALVIAAMAAACDSPLEPSPDLRGGVVATFQVSGEQFRVFVRNPTTIAQLIQLQQGFALASIPNGRLRRGAGAGNHNAPYSWHLDPEDIQLAGFTMELCDGRPSYVEDHVDEYADVGRYCPWGAQLVKLEDFRN